MFENLKELSKACRERTTIEKSHLKTSARRESDCTLRLAFSSLIKKTFQTPDSQIRFYTSLKC